jgi:hypothetical protein
MNEKGRFAKGISWLQTRRRTLTNDQLPTLQKYLDQLVASPKLAREAAEIRLHQTISLRQVRTTILAT